MKKLRWHVVLIAMILPVVAIAFVIISVASDVHTDLKSKEAKSRLVTSRTSVRGEFDPKLMTHRLILWDEKQGVANDVMAANAYGNVSRFLTETASACNSEQKNIDFLSCANNVLARNFYYKASNPVAPAWSQQYSDCDLNVYLMLDAMERAGKKGSIVYAPGHAFLAFKDEITGEWLYWETTWNYNRGKQADLSDTFYRMTPQHFYYTPMSSASAEQLYPSLILREAGTDKSDAILSHLLQLYPDNPLLTDRYFRYKKVINDIDAKKIEDLINTDITSSDKLVILARYFIDNGQESKAASYLNRIADDECDMMCLRLKQHFSLYYRSILSVSEILKSHGISVTANFIIDSSNKAFNHLIWIIFALIVLAPTLPLLKAVVCKTTAK